MTDTPSGNEIAIVGMSGRFPGAGNLEQFWKNLHDGVESIRPLSDDELRAAGVPDAQLLDPAYVKSAAVLDDVENWDAAFWGFTPRDASIMDPQHRLFLDCAWEALESAGHAPERFEGPIGVFAGCGMQAYMSYNLLPNRKLMDSSGLFLVRHTGNDKDFLSTRVSYSLNLTGPSINVQTACSTSLVAVHLAAQSLLNGEIDMALAGGVTIELPHRVGYTYNDGEILSPDGHCRAFDARAQGTVFGSGAGVVVLRRLADAIADGDNVLAVLLGTAVNNDGSAKVGYLAPSVDGQAASIVEALGIAGVDPDSISYIETHGTGTPIGDPIEIAALTKAFRSGTDRNGFCTIGSLKTNIGHLDAAAGVAGLIKTVLALQHRKIPPSLNYSSPNPAIDFDNSPFRVNAELSDWIGESGPLRAGISSLGVGGTNAHVVVEEAPKPAETTSSRPWQLLQLSAKSLTALDAATANLADHLHANRDLDLADAAFTLHVGRQELSERRIAVCQNIDDAVAALENLDPHRVFTASASDSEPSVAFMFAGGGAQYATMGAGLYRTEEVFRNAVDECVAELRTILDFDLLALLYPDENNPDAVAAADAEMERASRALPALFVTQYASARLWMSWGINPGALIGHSVGEYMAAHLAGVFSLRDALALVSLRGRLFETVPPGGMLSVSLSAGELRTVLGPELSVAAENAPNLSVASGPVGALDQLESQLSAKGVDTHRIRIEVAAHSGMLEPILAEFGAFLNGIAMNPPSIPFISNLTGTWITGSDAADPDYWVRHLRGTVMFSSGVGELLADRDRILLEVGPGRVLTTLARQQQSGAEGKPLLYSIRHPNEPDADVAFTLTTLGRLWAAGVDVDWTAFYAAERRRRVLLPTYPFERQRHWVDAPKASDRSAPAEVSEGMGRREDVRDWFYTPAWQRTLLPEVLQTSTDSAPLLVFMDAGGIASAVVDRIRSQGRRVVTVTAGDDFSAVDGDAYSVSPGTEEHFDRLFAELRTAGALPAQIVHAWNVSSNGSAGAEIRDQQDRAFYSLFFLARALAREDVTGEVRLDVLSSGVQQVAGESSLEPVRALLLGPCRVIPSEFPNVVARSIDIVVPESGSWQEDALAGLLSEELDARHEPSVVAYRDGHRWTEQLAPVRLGRSSSPGRLRQRGVYLITGGLGGIGMVVAEHLARTCAARMILVGRTGLPSRDEWDAILASNGGDPRGAKIKSVRALEAHGAEVVVAAADVSDADAMARVVRDCRETFGEINGVIHAAGVLDDEPILSKTRESAAKVLAPKVAGTLALDAALAGEPLDFLILFSSVSSFAGLPGQVDYAAANAFLDAYARARTQRDGTFTVAVNWSAWQDVGMLAVPEDDSVAVERTTSHPLLERVVHSSASEHLFATVLSVDTHWMMKEHRIRDGHSLIPGSGYLEIVRAAFAQRPESRAMEIRDVAFLSPFVLPENEAREMRVHLQHGESGSTFLVAGRPADESGHWEEHVTGSAAYLDVQPRTFDINAIRQRCNLRSESFDGTEELEHLELGPRWKNLTRVDYGQGEALALLELPPEFAGDLAQFKLHPALLDMATACAQSLIPGFDAHSDFYVPLSYTSLVSHAPLPQKFYSHVELKESDFDPREIAVFDVTMMDESGAELVSVSEFMMTRIADREQLGGSVSRSAQRARRTSVWLDDPRSVEKLNVAVLDGAIHSREGVEAFDRILSSRGISQIAVIPEDPAALISRLRQPTGNTTSAIEPANSLPLEEVESVLLEHAAVVDAAVVSRKDRPGNVRLVAYVIQDRDQTSTVSDLRRFLKSRLPAALVPSSYVPVDEIPRLSDGSPDRASLPDPFGANDDLVPPRTSTEQIVAEVWKEVLGLDRVSVYDNFFDVGGHSLLSVRVVVKLEKRTGVRLNQAVMVLQTLEQIAAECDRRMSPADEVEDALPETDGAGIGRRLMKAFKLKTGT